MRTWTSERWPRRRLLQAGLPVGAAALLAACGGGKTARQESPAGGGTPTTGGTVAGQAGAVARIQPGHYEKQLAASQEELDIAKNVRRGGTIKFLYLDPPHFDPARGYSCTIFDTASLVYNKLLKANLGAQADLFKLELVPDLAEKWEMVSPDATEFTFFLRKNVKWQNLPPVNGRPFTAEDVKIVFERYASGGVQKDFFSMVDRFELPDQYTIKAKLKEPYVDFPATVATYSFIVPRELWLNSDKVMTEVVGTGPFIRESWTPKQGSTFVRNPDYWELGADGKPLPYVDRIETFVEANPAAQKAGYRAGKWHVYVPTDTADGEDLLKTSPDTVWLDVPQSRGGNVNGFQFNMNKTMLPQRTSGAPMAMPGRARAG